MKIEYIYLIIGIIIGVFVSYLFYPDIEESIKEETETQTDVEVILTEKEYEELIANPDTVYITETEIVYIDTKDNIQQSRASYSDRTIGLSANIFHTGDIVDVHFEYVQKVRFIREINEVQLITNNITTTRTITRTIKPSHKIQSSIIASPNMFGATIGFKHRNGVGVSIGQDFVSNDPILMLSVEFTPSDIIRNISPF